MTWPIFVIAAIIFVCGIAAGWSWATYRPPRDSEWDGPC